MAVLSSRLQYLNLLILKTGIQYQVQPPSRLRTSCSADSCPGATATRKENTHITHRIPGWKLAGNDHVSLKRFVSDKP
jgi:hypothetical protein